MMDMNVFTFDPSLTIKVGTLVADKIVVADLTIGSEDKPSGITIFDRITKQPYCVVMENGQLVSYAGKCEGNTFTSRVTQQATVIQFIPVASPSPQSTPTTETTSTPTTEPSPSPTPEAGGEPSPSPSSEVSIEPSPEAAPTESSAPEPPPTEPAPAPEPASAPQPPPEPSQ
jgi:hypothetical protein